MPSFIKKSLELSRNFCYKLSVIRHLHKKKVFVGVGTLVIFLTIIPTRYAQAEPITLTTIAVAAGVSLLVGIVGGVASYLTDKLTAAAIMMMIIEGMLLFGKSVLSTGMAMFSWAINNPIGLSLTNPANNPIINIGWTLTRDLTNMFFILGLAYIGLATALNISGFNTKKTFAKLLIFALLINFTPVIAGVIVDAANIVSDFFLSSVDFSDFQKIESDTANLGFFGKVKDVASRVVDPKTYVEFFMKMIFYTITGVILWLFALIFIMRNFVIWLLVILSPLAFFAGIFDFSTAQSIYKRWWKNFISWSFIAVPAGFFLYLTRHFFIGIMQARLVASSSAQGIVGKLLGSMAPYFIVMIFLGLALVATIKINATGSQVIVGAATRTFGKVKGIPKKAGAAVGAAAGAAAGAYAGSTVAGMASRAKEGSDMSKAEGGNFFQRRLSATRAAFKGISTKEGRAETRARGINYKQANKETLYRYAEQKHWVPAGTAEARREKALDTDAAMKRGQTMSEDAINAQLARKSTQEKHIGEQLGLIRAKAAKGLDMTERDKDILLRHGKLDGGRATLEALKSKPHWEAILKPEKAEERTIQYLTGWSNDEREARRKELTAEGMTETEVNDKIEQIERDTGGHTKTEAEEHIKTKRKEALKEETDKIIEAGKNRHETIDDKFRKNAAKQAEINVQMEAPHIEQNIRIDMTQERLDIMSNKQIENLQVDNNDLYMALNRKHVKVIEDRGTVKQLKKIDKLLATELEKGDESAFRQRAKWLKERRDNTELSKRDRDIASEQRKRFIDLGKYIKQSPRFVYGGPGKEETMEERREKENQRARDEEDANIEAERIQREEADREAEENNNA